MSLVVKFDELGEPTGVELDGKPIFVQTMDIQYRSCEPAKVVIEMYVPDIAGGLIAHHPNGDAVTETRELYAVSKEDHELLMQLKKKDRL